MTTNETSWSQARTYGNWRRPQTAGIYGLDKTGTMVLLGGFGFVILVLMIGGLLPGLVTGAGVLVVLYLMWRRDKHGRSLGTNISERVAGWNSRRHGSHLYRSGPLGSTDWGTHQLPGLASRLRLTEHVDAWNRPFALLYSPGARTFSVPISAGDPEGGALIDQETVNQRVAEWGGWLARLGDEPGLVGAAATIEAAPDTGARLEREVRRNADPDASPFAHDVFDEILATYPRAATVVTGYVTLTFSALLGEDEDGKKRVMKPQEMAQSLAQRLPTLTRHLEATGSGASTPLTAQRLCEVVRTAYDPEAAELITHAYQEGETPDLHWIDVGPVSHKALRDRYLHDGSTSVTWEMTGAPRGEVRETVLEALLGPSPEIDRKRVTLLYRPISSARAAEIVEDDAKDARFRATASKAPRERDRVAAQQAQAARSEESSGAGLVNFGMVVTATVTDPRREKAARNVVRDLAARSRLRLRVLYDAQDVGFVAALPLGTVLRRHLRRPTNS